MIPSSLLIKIFGVSVAGFLTIGVSVMVHEANKTTAETARKKLFGEPVPETLTDEEFSKKLSTWTPTAEKQKYLLDNWAASINHLPASFFTQW